ncbi:MAG: hypothetical protein R2713_13215 [Ilumatobacteraceae bacterium]
MGAGLRARDGCGRAGGHRAARRARPRCSTGSPDALPLVIGSAIAGIASLVALALRRDTIARAAAVLAVVAVVAGWGSRSTRGSSPTRRPSSRPLVRATLWALVATFAVAGVFVIPSLAWLFWLTQRHGWAAAELRHRRE